MWKLVQAVEDYTGLRLIDYSQPRNMLLFGGYARDFRRRHGFWAKGLFEYFNDRTLYRLWKECGEDLDKLEKLIDDQLWIIPQWQQEKWKKTRARATIQEFPGETGVHLDVFVDDLGERITVTLSLEEWLSLEAVKYAVDAARRDDQRSSC